jgi:hypothetical protein
MNSLNTLTVVVEPSHSMASSNTKNNNIFRLANGNYISRMAYVYMVASENMISHRYLTPNESRWVFDTKKVGSN